MNIVLAVFVGLAILGAVPVLFQNRMIFFPSRYDRAFIPGEGELSQFVPYETADGRRQWGFLIEPPPSGASATGNPRPNFYLVFYGNASSAMGMADYFEQLARMSGCGFFIVDYRGYGFNEGRPNEEGIVADALGAYDTMKQAGRFENGVGVFGHSLGAAAAFAVAEKRRVDRLVALSAFTSIDAMARRSVPWPLYLFVRTHLRNDERLARLIGRPASQRPAEIVLFHGRSDEIVPFEMGEELAAIGGDRVQFIAVDSAGHNDLPHRILEPLARILSRDAPNRTISHDE